MALQNVPWAIGNGAHNSVEGARLSLYAATKGATGVMGPADMQVTALPVPGGAVRVHTGAGVAASRYPGASSQSYAVREMSSSDVEIDATGSSGSRTRFLAVRVSDHQYTGEPTPADVQDGPYNHYEWLASDPWTNPPAFPVVPLAKVVQPANTATITGAMITDIRRVANPRTQPELRTYALLAGDSANLTTTTGGDGQPTGGQTWPQAVESAWGEMLIPEWASWMRIVMMWTGARSTGGNVFGHTWVQVGATVNPDNVKTQDVKYDFPNTPDTARTTLVSADMKRVPASMRGTYQRFYPRGNRDAGSQSGKFLTLDGGSSMVLQVEFLEQI